MINYKSTRGLKKLFSFSEAILKGIAPDGGLFVPERLPKFSLKDLTILENKSYQEIANFVLNLFEPDFSKKEIAEMVTKAYGKNFDNAKIAPVVHLKDNQYLLELWHGPTSAFKDMALQLTPLLFAKSIEKNNKVRIKNHQKPLNYFILVATSGDTGKAALEGYKNKKNVQIMVLYPQNRVSKLQELAMTTQEGTNTFVYAVSGDFDDTQRLVKEIFDDEELNKKLYDNFDVSLSSGNSINWGRFLPQVVYHISSYLDLVNQNKIKFGEEIDVVIPTGNFGNILAGFVAKKMGLPIRKLICASNDNNVLAEFIQTGVYDITKRKLFATASPSIDILVASNLERLLFLITEDGVKVSQWMSKLKKSKKFSVDRQTKKTLQSIFDSGWISNEKSLENIKKIFDETGYLMDTHTSVAQQVAESYKEKQQINIPIVINSTAHFAKFASAVYSALLEDKRSTPRVEQLNEFEMLEKIKKLSPKLSIPKNLANLKHKRVIHKTFLKPNKNEVENAIIQIVK